LAYSRIIIQFDNYYNEELRFENDLGTNLPNGAEVGCLGVSGLTLSRFNRLKCTIQHGIDIQNLPYIQVENYEKILPFTEIKLLVANIMTLKVDIKATIKIGIKFFFKYGDTYTSSFFYEPRGALSPSVKAKKPFPKLDSDVT